VCLNHLFHEVVVRREGGSRRDSQAGCSPALLREKFEQLMQRAPGLEFLDSFKTPFQESQQRGAAIAPDETTAGQSGARPAKN
jgi:hypothetical protein